MRTHRSLALVGAAAVLVAGGCSGGASTDREPTVVEESIIDRMAEPSDDSASVEETEAARNEFVSACMAEEDLEYLGPPEAPSMIEWLGLTEEQFGAEYGFGHATTIDVFMVYEAFAAGEFEEYQTALEALPAADREKYVTRERECLQQSYAEFGFPRNGTVVLPNDSPIHEYTMHASEATAGDSRITEVTEAWSACMLEQGYDFADRDEMGLPLQQEAEAFKSAYASQGQALVDAGSTWEALGAADVLDAEQLAELEDLQQRELAVAAAHRQCIDAGHDIESVYSEVYDEHLADAAGS
ncbi:hypothetical protein [Glycomyces sp. NPDC021274]|uniref:hypothetical protein n=1 Tax=Glycomyces sp. NPDC021274 TaxID=3155120 RepID=UPI0033F384B8